MATVIKILISVLLSLQTAAVYADHSPPSANSPPRILLLLSYDPLYPIAQEIVTNIRLTLESLSPKPATLHVEFMDADYISTPEYLARYREMLRAKHNMNNENYTLIITAGDAALNLVADNPNLFHNIPVVFLGASDANLIRALRARGGFTGMHESLPVYEYIALMRYLYPGFNQLHVITDGIPGGEERLKQIQQAAVSLHENLIIHSLADNSWDELTDKLEGVKQQPILLLSARADKNALPLDFVHAVQQLSQHAGSPIWHLWQQGIGQGLAGGVVSDIAACAHRAAVMAINIMIGSSVNDLNVQWHNEYITLLDVKTLQHFGFAPSDLPSGARLLNVEPDFLQQNRHQILFALSVGVMIIAVLLVLWSEVRRRRLSDSQLDQHTDLMRNILDSIPDLMFYKDNLGRYVFSNRRFNEFFGKDPLGQTDHDLFDKETADFFHQKDKEALARKNGNINEEWVHGIDGSVMLLETQKTPIYDRQGELTGIFGLSRDITELKKAQENLQHIAHHDVLTGLPNRLLLNKRLEYALQLSRRSGESLAVIFLDLDRFKDINDTIGHDVGDLLLKDVAHRLHNNVRDSDICARLGGDEFVVVLTQIESPEKIQEKAELLLQAISRPYTLQGHLLSVFASAGISIYPDHGNTVDELIRNADAALHKAKELGRNRFCHYQRELTDTIHSRMSLEQDLRSALQSHDFVLVFQPQFRANENSPRRVEALLRWPHPIRGMISPLDFIPLAETSGMITDLGFWVVKSACQQFMFWRQQGLILEKIAVNVSAIQINASFAKTIANIMQHLEFNPVWLELEVTESLMMSGTTEVNQQVQQLRSIGVEFAIDDFGTGYSSLSKIKSMPVTVLKIDQSFVRDINNDVNNYEIVRAILLMAKSLGLTVVAEGVENPEQQQTLQRIGCEWFQGYYYAQPMGGDEFFTLYGSGDDSV